MIKSCRNSWALLILVVILSSCGTLVVFKRNAQDKYVPDCGFVTECTYYPKSEILEVNIHLQNTTDYIWQYHGIPCDSSRVIKSVSVKIVGASDSNTIMMKAEEQLQNVYETQVDSQSIMHCKYAIVHICFANNQPDKILYLKRFKEHYSTFHFGC
jgi:sorbitol-specific phosphotransferase system component IIBC